MIGEEDLILQVPYSTSVVCKSTDGLLFVMKSVDFFRKLKSNEESWRVIML